MKKYYFSVLLAAISCSFVAAQNTATFEDLELPADSVWDGSDMSGKFVSGNFLFINNFADWGAYTTWDGFALSTMSSSVYTSLADQYNSCTGGGAEGSQAFGVVYYSAWGGNEPTVMRADSSEFIPSRCYVTNSAYAYTSMSEGDDYAKKFEADDWFKITATGYLEGNVRGTVDFMLASEGEIVNEWKSFDLFELGVVDQIHFTLSSSDNGDYGMNTPAYFCIDNFEEFVPTFGIESVSQESGTERLYDLTGMNKRDARGFVIRNGKAAFIK